MGKIARYRRSPVRAAVNPSAEIANAQAPWQAAAQVFDLGADIAVKIHQAEERKFEVEKTSEFGFEADKIVKEHTEKWKDDPMGGADELQQKLSELSSSYGEAAPSGRSRESFEFKAGELSKRYLSRAGEWAKGQTIANTETSADKTFEQKMLSVQENARISEAKDFKRELDLILEPYGELVGQKQAHIKKQQYAERLAKSNFRGLLEQGHIGIAEQRIEDKEYQEMLGAEGVSQVRNSIKAHKKALESSEKYRFGLSKEMPYEFLNKEKKLQSYGFKDIDFNQPLASQIASRSVSVDMAKMGEGIEFMPLLAGHEVKQLEQRLGRSNDLESASFIADMKSSMTQENFNNISSQLLKDSPEAGIMLSMANGSISNAIAFKNGNEALKQKRVDIPKDITLDLDKNINLYVSGNDGLSEMDSSQIPIARNAIKSLAAHIAEREGESSVGNKHIEQANKTLFGEKVTPYPMASHDTFGWGNKPILSFRNDKGQFVGEDEFNDLIDSITDDNLKSKPVNAYGEEISVDKWKEHSLLVFAGGGKYKLKARDGFFKDKKGNDYILDLKKLYSKRAK